ncbi:hypothetical protein EV657_11354 [Rhodovulum visakhapatnamense]|uniref:Uncharacterized protein n=1 Tax=Rhodovulum visakhapatnamense TaxID=364297 RepID=A0A4R8FWT5_9RHOB|nr:hypothetical protein EV657_11354 [Rhodovulum visakhapatnamense]
MTRKRERRAPKPRDERETPPTWRFTDWAMI